MSYAEIKDTIFNAIDEALANLHTSTVGKIVAVNATSVDVKPVINRQIEGANVELPIIPKVPIFNLIGGTSYIHMPVAVGDYCVLVFGERCTDAWFAGNDNVLPIEYRMHDYSDAIALIGLHNRNTALTIPSVIQVTGDSNHDGNAVHTGDRTQTGNITQTGDKTQTGNITQTGDKTQTGNIDLTGNITQNGDIDLTGNITQTGDIDLTGNIDITSGNITISGGNVTITGGDVTADGISVKGHVHSGVTSGPSVTGPPV